MFPNRLIRLRCCQSLSAPLQVDTGHHDAVVVVTAGGHRHLHAAGQGQADPGALVARNGRHRPGDVVNKGTIAFNIYIPEEDS